MPIKTWRQVHKEKNINPIDKLVMEKGKDATK